MSRFEIAIVDYQLVTLINCQTQEKFQKFRCDWLHTQDPPDDEDSHDVPDNELFEVLKDEDFYKGSLNQLADELEIRKVRVIGNLKIC